jgi:rod shape-determining protein MreC
LAKERAIKPLFSQGPSSVTKTLVLVLVSLLIALIYVFTDWFAPLKKQAQDIVSPFYWVTDLPNKADNWADARLMSRERLVQENDSLRTEILVLKRKLQLNASLAAENVRLRQLLNSAETLEDRVLIAELIGVSPDPAVHQVIVNRGSDHGVYKGQALVDARGLMGQVVEVGKRSSKVLLITDITHALPVQINRNGVRFIVEGVGDLYKLVLRHVANTQDVVEGDMLVSSGLGQRFPVGYPVAEVIEVVLDPSKPFARVIAKPMAELNRSRHVLLVFDRPPAEGK